MPGPSSAVPVLPLTVADRAGRERAGAVADDRPHHLGHIVGDVLGDHPAAGAVIVDAGRRARDPRRMQHSPAGDHLPHRCHLQRRGRDAALADAGHAQVDRVLERALRRHHALVQRVGHVRAGVEPERHRRARQLLAAGGDGDRPEHRVAALGERLHQRATAQLVVEVDQLEAAHQGVAGRGVAALRRDHALRQGGRCGHHLEGRAGRLHGVHRDAGRGPHRAVAGVHDRDPAKAPAQRVGRIRLQGGVERGHHVARPAPGTVGDQTAYRWRSAPVSVIDGTPPSTGFSDCSRPPWPYMELAGQPSATRCLRWAAVCGARTNPVSV